MASDREETRGTWACVCLAHLSRVELASCSLGMKEGAGHGSSAMILKCSRFSLFLSRYSRFLNKCFFICSISLEQLQILKWLCFYAFHHLCLFCWGVGLLRRRQWHPTPVLLPGKSYGRRSLAGCSPWGHRVGHD